MNFETLLSDSRAVAAPHDTHTHHTHSQIMHTYTQDECLSYTQIILVAMNFSKCFYLTLVLLKPTQHHTQQTHHTLTQINTYTQDHRHTHKHASLYTNHTWSP